MSDEGLAALQRRLAYQFSEPQLLVRALTHRSFGAQHNERLEFLGDAVLGLAMSSLLYSELADSNEGDLTRVRAHWVRADSLFRIAQKLELATVVRLGEGEARGGGAQRPSILADAVEAMIGACYLDGGFEVAKALVQRLFADELAKASTQAISKDAKTELQERLQARHLNVPSYRIVAVQGQAHAQTFELECSIAALGLTQTGTGKSRRAAEQDAARRMLALLAQHPPQPDA